jgi:transposase
MEHTANPLPEDPQELQSLLIRERAAHAKTQQREARLEQQIRSLLEALRLARHRQFGASSEKAPGQSELFDEADIPVEELADADVVDEGVAAKPREKAGVRKPLPKHLPRVRRVIDIPEDERQCPCGCELTAIGEESSEQLDIIPAQVQVIETIRKKNASKACEDTVKTAPKAPVLLPKSIASGNTMAYIIAAKYADGLPLYRLSGILSRYGVDLPRQTLSESVLKVAEKILPLIDHMSAQLQAGPVMHMDETRVQVLNEPDKPAQSQSYMWVQRGGPPGKSIIQFTYDPSRGAAVPGRLLNEYQGALMTDGYAAYRTALQNTAMDHLCCWAHVRRKFVEAQKAQPKGKAGRADVVIGLIAKLYAVEKQHKNSDAATRHHNRQERSLPIMTKLHTQLRKYQQQVPPKTAVGRAVNYALDYWPELNRYVENGDWPIDNNPAENAIRPFVIGRKAWLFSNSQRGATGSANLYSLIETAKANGREPYHYLSWLFEKLPTADLDDIDRLMPWNAPLSRVGMD